MNGSVQSIDTVAVLKKPYKPTDIEIRNVTRFSYGEMTDGAYVIWAQGKAGWFEIRPTAQYKPIYDDMVQAVELLYFVTDIYSEARKKGGGPSADLVFQEVSTTPGVVVLLDARDNQAHGLWVLTCRSTRKTSAFLATTQQWQRSSSTTTTCSS